MVKNQHIKYTWRYSNLFRCQVQHRRQWVFSQITKWCCHCEWWSLPKSPFKVQAALFYKVNDAAHVGLQANGDAHKSRIVVQFSSEANKNTLWIQNLREAIVLLHVNYWAWGFKQRISISVQRELVWWCILWGYHTSSAAKLGWGWNPCGPACWWRWGTGRCSASSACSLSWSDTGPLPPHTEPVRPRPTHAELAPLR